MKKACLFLMILAGFSSPSFAGYQKTIDSLQNQLKAHMLPEHSQLQVLNELSVLYANMQYDSGFVMVERAIALAGKLNDRAQLALAWNHKGCLLLRKSNYTQAKEYFKRSLTLFSSLKDKDGMAGCYNRMAEVNFWQGENAEEMDRFIRKAQQLYEQTDNTNGLAQCSYLFARWNEFGEMDSTTIFRHTHKALLLFDRAGDITGKAATYNFMGVTYEMRSDYVNALQSYHQAIALNTSTQNAFGLCNDYINISGCYFSVNDYSKAIESAVKGLKLSQQLDDIDAQVLIYGLLGNTYREIGQTEKALQSLELGLKMAEGIGSKKRIGQLLTDLHGIYMDRKEYTRAFACQRRTIEIDRQLNSASDLADDYTRIAESYMKISKYDSALANYRNSFDVLKTIGENLTYANNLLWYGRAVNKTPDAYLVRAGIDPSKRHEIYRENVTKALEVGKKIGVVSVQRDALLELSNIYETDNDLKSSLAYYRKYTALKDTLQNAENSKSVNSLLIQYETEKKEQQIALLNKDNVIKEKEIGRQKLLRNGVIGGLGIVSGFLVLIFLQRNKIAKGKQRSDELLLNILPSEVAEELKQEGRAAARQFDDVTVMFTDFKDFTMISEKLTPSELVSEIHSCFKAFDEIITRHNIEKIKTMGDSYMCVGGLPVANATHAVDVVNAAVEILDFMERHMHKKLSESKDPFEIRIGIHTGPVVAGIVGVKKFAYDIWGDTVNIASRMESGSEPGKINISGATYALVKQKYNCIPRGKVKAKNKGEIEMYFVEGIST